MEVILLERIEKLGAIGDVVKVKNGYARNFLLPNNKALRANEANRKVFEANRELLEAQGHKIAKNQIVLDRPIKAIGMQDVKIALHPEVAVTIHVNVARSPEEAELQAQGVDVMAEMFEKDSAGFTEDFDPNAEPGEIATDREAPAAEAEAEGEAANA